MLLSVQNMISPAYRIIIVYILAAVVPALLLMRYIYNQDRIEKEPSGLLVNLALRGAVAVLLSVVLEVLGLLALNRFLEPGTFAYTVIEAFAVVAVVEEGAKFLLLYRKTWRHPNFNYRFDAVIYAVFVSLGFAALENIVYVFSHGLGIALLRAVLSIPGHMGFAVFMGVYYGRAKLCSNQGDRSGCRSNLWRGYLVAVFLHGVYDTCCMMGTVEATELFLLFVIAMYIRVYRRIRRESQTDAPV